MVRKETSSNTASSKKTTTSKKTAPAKKSSAAKKAPAKKPTSKKANAESTLMKEMGERFERALAVVDAAITGALFAGIEPYSFEPVLSYSFIRVAADIRGDNKFETWMASDVFDKVIEAITDVFEHASENVVDALSADQFFALRDACENNDLSIFEERREQEIALSIIDWSLLRICDDEALEMILVELILLVAWFKVAALAGNVEAETYLKVRNDAPRLLMAYHDVLER